VDAGSETATVKSLLDGYGSAADWPAEQARWLAVSFLKQYDPTDARTGDQREFDSAKVLMKSAITGLDQAGAVDAFDDVAKLAQARPEIPIVGSSNRPVPNWCWRLLTELQESRPGGAPRNLQLELAWQLADEERSERLRKALVLADGFESVLRATQLSTEERQQQMEIVDYIRARADRGLKMQGEAGRADEAERLFRKLLDSKLEGIAPGSYLELARLLYERGGDDKAHAHALLQEAAKKWPDDSSNAGTDMFLRLQDGDVAAVSKFAEMAEKKADEQKKRGNEDSASWWLFHASIGLMITQSGDWRNLAVRLIDQGKTFDFRDYHLMTFYAYCPGPGSDAEKLLKERWGEIKPEKWDAMLTNGDTEAWREMLVWGFKDEARSKKLLETLEDEEKWKASKLSQLPNSLRGQRCEAWFYAAMRAKASGQADTVRQCLRKCVAVGMKEYYEHAMAVCLLRQMGERL
jgi:tetratricopeptide (TPR) repeat protein